MRNTSNISYETPVVGFVCFLERNQTTTQKYRRIMAFTVISVLIIVTNILMIISICRKKKFQRLGNMYYISIALSDLVTGTFALPVLVSFIINDNDCGSITVCSIWQCVDIWATTLSFYNLCALSVDRYQAIRNPLKHVNSPKRVLCRVIFIWLLTSVMIFVAFGVMTKNQSWIQAKQYWCFALPAHITHIIPIVASYYCPTILMISLYCLILHTIQNYFKVTRGKGNDQLKFNGETTVHQERTSVYTINVDKTSINEPDEFSNAVDASTSKPLGNQKSYETKSIRTLGIIMCSFSLAWFPFLVVFPLSLFVASTPPWSRDISVSFVYLSAAVNPIAYLATNAMSRNK